MLIERNIVLKFGVLASVIICLVLFIGVSLTDLDNPDLTASFFILTSGMIVAFLLLFPAIGQINSIEKRSFGQNVLWCLAIVLVSTIIYSLAWTVYVFWINPEIVKSMETFFMGQLDPDKLTAIEFAKEKEGVEAFLARYENPITTFIWTLIEPTPSGFLMTLIVSTIQYKKNK